MKVIVNANHFTVRWRYLGRETQCEIRDPLTGTYASHSTICSPKDRFVKNIGRKISMHRAVLQLFPNDPGFRELFFERYFQMRNGKW